MARVWVQASRWQRARAEDRIRALKDTGMRNLPFRGYAQNQIWLTSWSLSGVCQSADASAAGFRLGSALGPPPIFGLLRADGYLREVLALHRETKARTPDADERRTSLAQA
jgi:hypothetical protein